MRPGLFQILKTAGIKVQPKHQEFLDEHFSVDPKWKQFRAKLRSPAFLDAVKADTRADTKLKRYSEGNAKHLQARGVPTFPVPSQSSGSKTYDVKYHADADRFTCNCGDWIHKRSWRKGQTTRDCKHIGVVKNKLKSQGITTQELTKQAAYREPGSFTHDSTLYDLNKALQRSDTKRTEHLSVKDLSWVLSHASPDPTRMEKADLSAPILVAPDSRGRPTVVDGLHRLAKAHQNKVETLPSKTLSEQDLAWAMKTAAAKMLAALG